MLSNKTSESSNLSNQEFTGGKSQEDDSSSSSKTAHNSDLLQIARKLAINSSNILRSSFNSQFKNNNSNFTSNHCNNTNKEPTFLSSLVHKTASFLNSTKHQQTTSMSSSVNHHLVTTPSKSSDSSSFSSSTSASTPSTSIVFQQSSITEDSHHLNEIASRKKSFEIEEPTITLLSTNRPSNPTHINTNTNNNTTNNNRVKSSYLTATSQYQRQKLFQQSSTSNSSFNNFNKNDPLLNAIDDQADLADNKVAYLTINSANNILDSSSSISSKQIYHNRSFKLIDPFKVRSNSINISQNPNQSNNNSSLNRCLLKNLTRETNQLSYVIEDSDGFIQLNQYKLKNEIGKGSYGIVKLAYNDQDNRNYAMKMISKKKLIKKSSLLRRTPSRQNSSVSYNPNNQQNYMLDRVYKEIAILKKLDHQNVVKLIEVLDDPNEDYLCLAFEYFEKGTLIDIPTDYPLSETIAWKYFRELTLGIEYLHYQKIIHRDIKPSNLLLGNDNHIKIADFGVSNEFDGDDAIISNSLGTPAFTPPEAITEHSLSWLGKPLDIWSMGITLFAFVFGHCPFQDECIVALRNKILYSNVQFPDEPKISIHLKDLIQKLLNKDPTKRIKMESIKKHKWITTHPIKNEHFPLTSNSEIKQITVTDDEVKNSVVSLSKLDTIIFIKSMIKKRSFGNPYRMQISSISNHSSIDVNN